MGLKRTDEFRQDAVRIAQTSGLTRKQVADDLGVGMSTLNKWITAYRDTDVVSKEDLIWRDTWETRRKAEMAIFEYINGFYNPRRRHSALGWKSPVAFERKVA
jgi:transposase